MFLSLSPSLLLFLKISKWNILIKKERATDDCVPSPEILILLSWVQWLKSPPGDWAGNVENQALRLNSLHLKIKDSWPLDNMGLNGAGPVGSWYFSINVLETFWRFPYCHEAIVSVILGYRQAAILLLLHFQWVNRYTSEKMYFFFTFYFHYWCLVLVIRVTSTMFCIIWDNIGVDTHRWFIL